MVCYARGRKIVWFKEFVVRAVIFVKNLAWWVVAMLALMPAWAQTVVTPHSGAKPTGHVPTRMQRCELEVVGLKGADRTRGLRECLVNRNEGERIVSRNCFRQFRDLPPGGTKVDKSVFMKHCVAAGLKAGHDKLPARKPAPAAVSGASAAAKPVAKATDTPATARAVAPAKPASGTSGKPEATTP
jgi:hypothetical protein